MKRFVTAGALAGVAGGAALALVLLVAGEGPIGQAVALEKARHAGEVGGEIYSRGAQHLGGVLAGLIFGAALGCMFGIVFAVVRPRLRQAEQWSAPWRLASVGFVSVFLLPFLKYPANPPGVGDPETIARRSLLYVVAVGWSLMAAWAGWRLWRYLSAHQVSDHVRAPAALGLALGLAALGLAVLPPNTDAVSAPATLIWHFRIATAAGAAALWTVMGVTFSWLLVSEARRHGPSGDDSEPLPVAAQG